MKTCVLIRHFSLLAALAIASLMHGNSWAIGQCPPVGLSPSFAALINGDRVADLICRFQPSRTGLLPTDTRAFIRFSDVKGTLYQGWGSVRVVTNGVDDKDDLEDSD